MIAMRESLRRDLSRSANSIAQVNLFPPRFVLLSLAFYIIENKNSVRYALLSAAAIASRKCECSCRAIQTAPLKLRLS